MKIAFFIIIYFIAFRFVSLSRFLFTYLFFTANPFVNRYAAVPVTVRHFQTSILSSERVNIKRQLDFSRKFNHVHTPGTNNEHLLRLTRIPRRRDVFFFFF